MSHTAPGRHRAPRQALAARAGRLLPSAPLARGSAVAVATSGLILSFPAGASSAPAAGVTQLPSAPASAAAAALAPAAVPSVVPTLPAQPAISGTLRWGSRGESVRVIQRIVGTVPDGVFGPKTHAAVKRYQARNGLVADGIVGPKTARAMGIAFGTASRSTSTASRSAPRASTSTSSVLSVAAQYTGIMYRYGGTSPSTGFDCSGFTQFVFGKVGVKLPRTADAQRRATTRVSNPQPGDLVFFGSPAYHVGIYAGNGMMYDSGRSGLPTQKRKVFSGVSGYGRVG